MRWKSDRFSGWGGHLDASMEVSRASRNSALKAAFEERPGPAIGGLRSYGDAALNADGPAHMMTRMDRLLEFDTGNGILRAEAGVTMRTILSATLPQGWAPSALPGTGYVTLGGAVAMDVHGKDHRTVGTFSAQVLSLSLLTPNGKIQTLSPEKKPPLFWATIGGLGQTGIVQDVTLQLHPASEMVTLNQQRFDDLDDGMALLEAAESRFAVAWIDALSGGRSLGRGILETSDYSDADAQQKERRIKTVPVTPPKLALSAPIASAFNSLRFRSVTETGKTSTESFLDVQYPLDRIDGWNKLYGKDGFHQFQACFPLDQSRDALTALLERVSNARAASPLVVMKRLGPSGPAPMSFPQEGYTLAIDMQHRSKTPDLLAELSAITAQHNGRIYFAKDSSLTPELVSMMYPQMASWKQQLDAVDPDQTLSTDMTRRLGLR
ncbi:MAG: FAD-binding oxidoreductase [Pseudomonadota bacterium]